MIVTLSGANDLLRRQELHMLTQAFVQEHGSMAVERVDGEEASTERMQEALMSLPFLTPRKLVILREASKQKAFAETIAETIAALPESTDVIFYEPKLDKRLAYYKTLKKATDFREYGEPDGRELANWAVARAKELGGELNMTDARLLVDRLGANQQLAESELRKLVAYDPHITKQTIQLLVEATPQSTIFELLDAAFAGDARTSFAMYQEQRALKVEPQAIIAMLAWQLHIIAVVKAGGNRSTDQIAKEAKLNPFVVRKTAALARRLTLERIKQLISELLTLDLQLKRSNIDADEALQLYLLRLSAI